MTTMNRNLTTKSQITWCPGCPNSPILIAFRKALKELAVEDGMSIDNVVGLSGIGCHGKITDYIKINTFTSLHGRLIPTMTGIKAANPELTVFGFSGDGDTYAEGSAHLLHCARRNSDVNLFIHDNQIFALTTGQATPVSPKGFPGKSTPDGSIEDPLDPLLFLLSVGATFVARAYAPDMEQTKELMKAAKRHKGFSFIDIIQPCTTYNNTKEFYDGHKEYLADDYDVTDKELAMRMVQDMEPNVKFGIFYNTEKPSFEELLHQ